MRSGSCTHQDLGWLGDLRSKGYPSLQPVRDVASAPPAETPRGDRAPGPDPRLGELVRENEALHSRPEGLGRLAAEFERRLSEASAAYEGATLEAECDTAWAWRRENVPDQGRASIGEYIKINVRDGK